MVKENKILKANIDTLTGSVDKHVQEKERLEMENNELTKRMKIVER